MRMTDSLIEQSKESIDQKMDSIVEESRTINAETPNATAATAITAQSTSIPPPPATKKRKFGLLVGVRVCCVGSPHPNRASKYDAIAAAKGLPTSQIINQSIEYHGVITRVGTAANGGWFEVALDGEKDRRVYFRRGSIRKIKTLKPSPKGKSSLSPRSNRLDRIVPAQPIYPSVVNQQPEAMTQISLDYSNQQVAQHNNQTVPQSIIQSHSYSHAMPLVNSSFPPMKLIPVVDTSNYISPQMKPAPVASAPAPFSPLITSASFAPTSTSAPNPFSPSMNQQTFAWGAPPQSFVLTHANGPIMFTSQGNYTYSVGPPQLVGPHQSPAACSQLGPGPFTFLQAASSPNSPRSPISMSSVSSMDSPIGSVGHSELSAFRRASTGNLAEPAPTTAYGPIASAGSGAVPPPNVLVQSVHRSAFHDVVPTVLQPIALRPTQLLATTTVGTS